MATLKSRSVVTMGSHRQKSDRKCFKWSRTEVTPSSRMSDWVILGIFNLTLVVFGLNNSKVFFFEIPQEHTHLLCNLHF